MPLTGEKRREYMRNYNRWYRSESAVLARNARVLRNSQQSSREVQELRTALEFMNEMLKAQQGTLRVVLKRE
jgi:hypothetical protein